MASLPSEKPKKKKKKKKKSQHTASAAPAVTLPPAGAPELQEEKEIKFLSPPPNAQRSKDADVFFRERMKLLRESRQRGGLRTEIREIDLADDPMQEMRRNEHAYERDLQAVNKGKENATILLKYIPIFDEHIEMLNDRRLRRRVGSESEATRIQMVYINKKGLIYLHNHNYPKAKEYFRESFRQGHLPAAINLYTTIKEEAKRLGDSTAILLEWIQTGETLLSISHRLDLESHSPGITKMILRELSSHYARNGEYEKVDALENEMKRFFVLEDYLILEKAYSRDADRCFAFRKTILHYISENRAKLDLPEEDIRKIIANKVADIIQYYLKTGRLIECVSFIAHYETHISADAYCYVGKAIFESPQAFDTEFLKKAIDFLERSANENFFLAIVFLLEFASTLTQYHHRQLFFSEPSDLAQKIMQSFSPIEAIRIVRKVTELNVGDLVTDELEDSVVEDLFAKIKAFSEYLLGRFYDFGCGNIKQDNAKAFSHYSTAAEMGNNNAQQDLAIMYRDGQGVEENPKEALRLLKMAHDIGSRDAFIPYVELMFKEDVCELPWPEKVAHILALLDDVEVKLRSESNTAEDDALLGIVCYLRATTLVLGDKQPTVFDKTLIFNVDGKSPQNEVIIRSLETACQLAPEIYQVFSLMALSDICFAESNFVRAEELLQKAGENLLELPELDEFDKFQALILSKLANICRLKAITMSEGSPEKDEMESRFLFYFRRAKELLSYDVLGDFLSQSKSARYDEIIEDKKTLAKSVEPETIAPVLLETKKINLFIQFNTTALVSKQFLNIIAFLQETLASDLEIENLQSVIVKLTNMILKLGDAFSQQANAYPVLEKMVVRFVAQCESSEVSNFELIDTLNHIAKWRLSASIAAATPLLEKIGWETLNIASLSYALFTLSTAGFSNAIVKVYLERLLHNDSIQYDTCLIADYARLVYAFAVVDAVVLPDEEIDIKEIITHLFKKINDYYASDNTNGNDVDVSQIYHAYFYFSLKFPALTLISTNVFQTHFSIYENSLKVNMHISISKTQKEIYTILKSLFPDKVLHECFISGAGRRVDFYFPESASFRKTVVEYDGWRDHMMYANDGRAVQASAKDVLRNRTLELSGARCFVIAREEWSALGNDMAAKKRFLSALVSPPAERLTTSPHAVLYSPAAGGTDTTAAQFAGAAARAAILERNPESVREQKSSAP